MYRQGGAGVRGRKGAYGRHVAQNLQQSGGRAIGLVLRLALHLAEDLRALLHAQLR